MHARLSRLVLPFALLLAGCSLPERDNARDSNLAPVVRIAVRNGPVGAALFEGTRAMDLQVDLGESSVPNGRIERYKLEQLDPRPAGGGTERCPLFEPVVLAEVIVAAMPQPLWEWDVHPNPCFELEPGTADRFIQKIRLKATGYSSKGGIGTGTFDFVLVNSKPVVSPGTAKWVDPAWSTTATIDGAEISDPDPDDNANRRDIWEQLSGPLVLPLGSNLGATFSLQLADPLDPEPYFGSTYILRVRSCDEWNDCSEPQLLDVHLERAVWAVTANAILQLDPSWAPAVSFDDGSGTTPFTPGASAYMATAEDGVWIFTPASPIARRVRSDMVARPVALPANFQRLVGFDGRGTAWVVTGSTGTLEVQELGPGETVSEVFTGAPSSFNGRTRVARHSPTSALWIGGFDVNPGPIGYYRFIRKMPGGTLEAWEFPSGSPVYECLDDTELRAAVASSDGSAWFASDTGVLHIGPDGTAIECEEVLDIGGDTISGLAIADNGQGGEDLLLIVNFDGFPTPFTPNTLRRWIPGGGGATEVLLEGGLAPTGVAYDRIREGVVVMTSDLLMRFAPGKYEQPKDFVSSDELFPNTVNPYFQQFQLAVEPSGRVWILREEGGLRELLRLPPSLSFVRGIFGGSTADAPEFANHTTIDPATGRLWVVENDGVGWWALNFDETGKTLARVELELPQMPPPGDPFVVGVRSIRYDAGAPGRTPGLWVQDAFEPVPGALPELVELRISHITLGTDLQTFGTTHSFGVGQTYLPGGFPNDADEIDIFRGARSAVDPTDGSLWVAIHDTDIPGDARLGEVYRLAPDGDFVRFDTQSVLTDTNFLESGAVWTPVGFFATGGITSLVRTQTSGSTATQICSPGDAADTAFHDAGAGTADPAVIGGEIAVFCVDDAGAHYVTRARVFPPNFVAVSLRAPVTNPFAADLFGPGPGMIGGVSGVGYMPEDEAIRLYDRYLNDIGLYQVPGRIVYFPL